MYGSKTYQDLKREVETSRPSIWETEVVNAGGQRGRAVRETSRG